MRLSENDVVLDASALLAVLRAERGAERVEPLLEEAQPDRRGVRRPIELRRG